MIKSTSPRPKKLTKAQRELQTSWDKITATHAPKKPLTNLTLPLIGVLFSSPPRESSTTKIKSFGSQVGNGTKPIHSKQLTSVVTIAPICNKGAYQVITDRNDFSTMGRKV
jgi:hypothetical protein